MTEIEEFLKLRENLYAFLYRMYVEEPPRELAEDLVNNKVPIPDLKPLNEDMAEGFEKLRKFMKASKDVDVVHERLTDEYTRLFLGPGSLPVLPYESVYIDGKMMGPSLLRLKKDYRDAGIAKSKEYPEPEDHIAFELKFMHHLCEEALKRGECMGKYWALQKEFMDEHLIKWVPDFCDDLYKSEQSDFYKSIAKITKGFIFIDKDWIDEFEDEL
ncbi:MAG: molecular chaperone TorD family protein [Methanocellales archaeon]|nr:molecular chaperone TorD family protein [Methanocellales archaeon]MDD3420811.1 molecular chaperone TorD family protein [Methanocellales archaeon]MDD4897930.1 molecular chaperone TorD family protein [Methanocellales archaeon]MDD5446348.1 molecular chaperone TorD family protein [Methanocellales archaeon]